MQLDSLLADELKLNRYQKGALEKLKLRTIKDLLWYFPFRYEKFSRIKKIAEAKVNEKASFSGKIVEIKTEKTWHKKLTLGQAKLYDKTGIINLVWFHQPFIAKILKKGDLLTVFGKTSLGKNGLYLANPVYEKISEFEAKKRKHALLAIYPETKGLTSRWFRFAVQKILKKLMTENKLIDPLPATVLEKYNLPSLKNALLYIHMPRSEKDAEAARKRFAFEEIFLIQVSRILQKKTYKSRSSFVIKNDPEALSGFLRKFPFKLTEAQKNAISVILKDLEKPFPMARLLEGDVGSGKTVVAAAASFATVNNNYQVAYMAPTEVLARQLFDVFVKNFLNSNARIKIGLATSSEHRKFPSKVHPEKSTRISKNQLLKWVAGGEINILIGTHALIAGKNGKKNIQFKNLALVIVDEQHRFGVNQRACLLQQGSDKPVPHLLSMTATPIPRTLALTIYGDLDLTLLDQMPAGRKKIITEIVPPNLRKKTYEKIKEEIKKGRQAYIICPRIETGSDKLEVKNVVDEARRLKEKIFPELEIAILHGKLAPQKKQETMAKFRKGEIDILVATSVVEVGIDVPRATIMVIESAERFGLAQLHQLRGRVQRSTFQAFCFVFTESANRSSLSRLKALKQAKNGFQMAEYDLRFRGPGELAGQKQWGVSDLAMEALKNIKMVEAARKEAQNILKEDAQLNRYPLLEKKLKEEKINIHFE
jgi:ATP-dependent DNA helicase RecG